MKAVRPRRPADRCEAPGYVPSLDAAELARRNAAAAALLDAFEAEGDAQEQHDTLAALREALGPGRTAADRPIFP